MAYISQETIEAVIAGHRQFIRLKKCTRADGTYDYFVGYTNGVPVRWQYLTETQQGGLLSQVASSNWAGYGTYSFTTSGGGGNTITNSSTINQINISYSIYNRKGTTGNCFSYIVKLNNDLNLVPIYTRLTAGSADNVNSVQFYARKNGNNVISYNGSNYTYDQTNGLPMDYKDIDEVLCRAYTYDDSGALHHRRGNITAVVRFCQRIPGDVQNGCFYLYS